MESHFYSYIKWPTSGEFNLLLNNLYEKVRIEDGKMLW